MADPFLGTDWILKGKTGHKSTGVKFNLPPDGDDNMNLTGFGEILAVPSSSQRKSLGQLGRQATGINHYWKPGQSIKKFDFSDLPSVASLADEIFKEGSHGLGNLLAESKGSSGFGIKKKGGRKAVGLSHGKSHGGESFNGGNPEFLKDNLMKVSAQIKGDIEANMGFGFTNSMRKPSPTFGTNSSQDYGKRAPQSHTKLVEKSITSLQNRIQEQRKKFQEYQTATVNFPTSPRLAKQQNPEVGKRSEAPPKNFFLRKKAQENAKLGEIARLFRESLEASAKDPNEIIRLPGREMSPARKSTTSTKGVSKSFGASKLFLGKPTSTVTTLTTGKAQKNDSAGLMELRHLLEHRSPSKYQPPEPMTPKLMDPLEFTKKKIQELENSDFSKRLAGKRAPSAEFADYLEAMEKEASSAVGRKPSARLESFVSQRYPVVSTEVLEKRLGASLKTMEEVGSVAKNLGSLMSRVSATRPVPAEGDGRPGNPDSPVSPKAPAVKKVTAAGLAKTLGLKFDVNSILSATSPRDQQKQLMKLTEEMKGIVAAAVKDEGDEDDGGSSPGSSSPNRNPLFRPTGQNSTTTGTSAAILGSSSSGKQFSNKKTMEVQTDGSPPPSSSMATAAPRKGPIRFEMPEISFVKEMSETDQRTLQELRNLKSNWENLDYGSTN